MSRNQLIIGLANQQLANTIWDELQWLSGTTNALTAAATNTNVGLAGGTVSFLGHTTGATRQVVPVAAGATTAIQALQALGLFSQS